MKRSVETISVIGAACVMLLAACGGKVPQLGPDYGPEDGTVADAKDDSARRPATTVALTIGAVKKTTFTRTAQWRGFVFAGSAGQEVDLLADGLRGLDTVLYLYRASRETQRPWGRSLAQNDDTENANWTLRSNPTPNQYSSSVLRYRRPASGSYALIVTTYEQSEIGSAEVTVRGRAACDPHANVKAYWLEWRATHPDPEVQSIFMEFATEREATSYLDPQQRRVFWIVRGAETATTVSYVVGADDAWVFRLEVDKATCERRIVAEH